MEDHNQRVSDNSTTLKSLKDEVLQFAKERDWEQFHSPKNLSMALSAEAGELLEHFLWIEGKASKACLEDPEKRKDVEDELADIIIYAIEFANVTGIDIASAIIRKMKENAAKYPVEKAKGNALKYDQL